MRKWFFAVSMSYLLVVPALADWNLGDPNKMHYPQLPNTSPGYSLGIDVVVSQPFAAWNIAADDWRCSETGPVNDIHIWGSWFNGQPDPNAQFKLSIHSDVPGTISHPGPLLWSALVSPSQYSRRIWAAGYYGHFYDPNGGGILGNDQDIWQYNFENLPSPFVQQQGTIYWLDVQVFSPQNHDFGWTSTDLQQIPHFMDDGMYGTTNGFNGPLLPPGWSALVYPPGHPYEGQSMDLAFVVTPEPASMGMVVMVGAALLRRRRGR